MSKFKKGQSGNPQGRPAGLNKQAAAARDIMVAAGFCPVTVLMDIALHGKQERVRREAASDLLARHSPALRAIELSGEVAAQYALNVIYAGKQKEFTSEDKLED